MTYRGGGSLSWQSDYAQFYLIDLADAASFAAPTDITDEIMSRRWCGAASGVVIYTSDCLQQIIDIRIFEAEPSPDAAEWRSGNGWSQTEFAKAAFPSRSFVVSSPSKAGTESYGPVFRVDAEAMNVRIQWMEFQGSRDDSVPVQPDVIRLDLWPSAGH